MPLGAQLLIAAVVVMTLWIVAHVALVVRVIGVTEITTRQRWLALIPFVTPVLGWQTGKRRHVIAWCGLVALYALLRAALALR